MARDENLKGRRVDIRRGRRKAKSDRRTRRERWRGRASSGPAKIGPDDGPILLFRLQILLPKAAAAIASKARNGMSLRLPKGCDLRIGRGTRSDNSAARCRFSSAGRATDL
jgi:hypothetical protein